MSPNNFCHKKCLTEKSFPQYFSTKLFSTKARTYTPLQCNTTLQSYSKTLVAKLCFPFVPLSLCQFCCFVLFFLFSFFPCVLVSFCPGVCPCVFLPFCRFILLYTIHYTLNTLQHTLYTIHYTLCTKHFTLYKCISYTLHLCLIIHTIHYTLYTIHYALNTLQNILYTLWLHNYMFVRPYNYRYTIQYTLYTIHYTLYIIHYTLYTLHYSLYDYTTIRLFNYTTLQLYHYTAIPYTTIQSSLSSLPC